MLLERKWKLEEGQEIVPTVILYNVVTTDNQSVILRGVGKHIGEHIVKVHNIYLEDTNNEN